MTTDGPKDIIPHEGNQSQKDKGFMLPLCEVSKVVQPIELKGILTDARCGRTGKGRVANQ